MIKKLKFKFVLTNMLLIVLVMIIAFALLYYNSARELKNDSISAMEEIASTKHDPLSDLFDKNQHKHSEQRNFVTYVLDIDTRTNTCYIDGFGDAENLTEENVKYINALIDSVHSKNENNGIIEEYNMRFLRIDIMHGERIVLLDKQFEDDSLSNLMFSFFISGSIAFVGFLLISLFVAKVAVKPVDNSIKQQQQLVADLSHELKTPITVISTNTDILLTKKDSTIESEQKWLNYIKDETIRMSDLVNMMLYLAKTDEGVSKCSNSCDFDLSNAAYEVLLPFESVCYEKNKAFTYDIESDVFISGDENAIKQLLVILLDNAVKYSNDNGKINFTIYSQNDKVLISVFNSGEPIPKKSIPYIFERFYRVDEARSRENGGSGLGLSIAKRIIEHNEGNISVSSSIEHGTVFMCTFKTVKSKNKSKN